MYCMLSGSACTESGAYHSPLMATVYQLRITAEFEYRPENTCEFLYYKSPL